MKDDDKIAMRAALQRKIERLSMERDHYTRLAMLASGELQSASIQLDRI